MRSFLKGSWALFVVALLAFASAAVKAETYDLFAGQHIKMGRLIVKNDTNNLYVTFQAYPGWVMTSTHLYVSGDKEPTKSAPGRFPFKHEGLDNVTVDTYTIARTGSLAKPNLYVAAHADVCTVDEGACVPDYAALVQSVPTGLQNVQVEWNWLTAEFTLTINGVSYPAWCVDEAAPYPDETFYSSLLVPGYEADGSLNGDARNLLGQQSVQNSTLDPLVALTYLLNQDYVINCTDPDFQYSIQLAIWYFTNNYVIAAGPWAPDASWVINDVVTNAVNYQPKCGDFAVVMLDPVFLTADPTNPDYQYNQHFAIAVPLTDQYYTGCETAWARGTTQFRTGWGSWFIYNIQ